MSMIDADFVPLRQHIANVLEDHKEGVQGRDDAVQAVMEHPEFAAAWDAYERANPTHGMRKEVGGKPAWWSAPEQMWKWDPVETLDGV